MSILNILRELCVTLLRATFSLTYVASTDTDDLARLLGNREGPWTGAEEPGHPREGRGHRKRPEGQRRELKPQQCTKQDRFPYPYVKCKQK